MVRRRTLLLAALAAALGVAAVPVVAAAQEPGTGTLTGTVTGTGGYATCVSLIGTDVGHHAHVATDPETGHYAIEVPPGSYVVQFDGACTGAPVVPELHPDAERWDVATPVAVTVDGTTTVDAELVLLTPVAGRFVDQFGDPVSCSVSSRREPDTGSIVSGFAYTQWFDGAFAVGNGGLPGGPQRLVFSCPAGYETPEPRIVTVGDPSVPFELGEVVVPLRPGSVSGTLSTEGHNLYPLGNACVIATSPAGILLGVSRATESRWTIADLPAGPVRILFRDCERDARNQEFVAEWYGDTTDFASAREVTVDADAPVTGVDATVTKWTHIAGGVFNADGRVVGGVCMWVTDVTQTKLVGVTYIPHWFFGTVRLLPGDYKVLMTDCGGGWRSVWVGGTDDPATAHTIHVGFDGANVGATVTPK